MVEVVYHGHSCVEINREGGCVFIDPFITGNPTCDLTIDAIVAKRPLAFLVTHGHSDHLGDAIELSQKAQAPIITTVEVARRCADNGAFATEEQHIGGSVDYGAYRVKFTHAFHGGAIMDSTMTGVAAGVLVFVAGKTMYHAGDTGLTKEMELLGTYESIDVALLPIGDRFTMGVHDAVRAASMIKATYVVPIHYNTWPSIHADPLEFSRLLMLDNIAVPKVLKPGQCIAL